MSAVALTRAALLLGGVGAVEALCRTGVIDRFTMIPPSEMAVALVRVLASGRVNADLAFTLGNVAAAIAVSIALGFALGVVVHALPRLRRVVAPMLAAYYAVPTFAFYPICVVIFGVNRLPLIAIGAVFGVVAMVVNTLDGIDRIPRAFIKTAACCRMNPVAVALLIKLPAAAPHLFTGVKLAVSYSVIGVIAGEFILSVAGLGRRIAFAYNDFDNATMYALLLLLLGTVTAVNLAINAWEQRLHRRWRRA